MRKRVRENENRYHHGPELWYNDYWPEDKSFGLQIPVKLYGFLQKIPVAILQQENQFF